MCLCSLLFSNIAACVPEKKLKLEQLCIPNVQMIGIDVFCNQQNPVFCIHSWSKEIVNLLDAVNQQTSEKATSGCLA
jgi:hypothetical protein